MRALAMETAGRDGSVALVDDGTVVAESGFPGGFRHAAGLLPLIDELMRAQGWSPADLDHVYVSAGPGSFTGIRIGVTAAKALAIAVGVRLVAVPSLAVIVENAPADAAHTAVVLDAKREQVFAATFERTPDGWAEREPAHLDGLTHLLARSPRPLHLMGDGIPSNRKYVPVDAGVIVTPPELWRPRASVVARLGTALAAKGRFVEPDQLLPTYIRKTEAEEKYDLNTRARPVQHDHGSN
jgi:tRNA threonylcarbamoyladenosine biosynthesis protein TsaB